MAADWKPTENAISGQKSLADFDPPKKSKRNIFAIACAMLASMSSILLSYSKIYYTCLLSEFEKYYETEQYIFLTQNVLRK